MSGEHPIDELFRQGLHDAEVPPPPAAWQGIARALDSTDRRNGGAGRWRWAVGVLLLLLGGAAGYWALADRKNGEQPVLAGSAPRTATPTTVGTAAQGPSTHPAPQPHRSGSAPTKTARNEVAPNADEGGALTDRTPVAGTPATGKNAPNAIAADHSTAREPRHTPSDPADSRVGPPVSGKTMTICEPSPHAHTAGGEETEPYAQHLSTARADVGMPTLQGRSTPLVRSEVPMPEGLLFAPTAVLPTLSGARWWLAVQGEHQRGSLEWRGGERGVAEALNASETWLGRWTLSMAVGRTWRSGWAVGGGVSFSEARSRFLRTTSTPDHVETVVDTAWVVTPMGQQTMYTWNIVESTVVEPGTTQVARANNTYREARVFLEAGRRVWARGRWSAHGRLSAGAAWTLTRAGNTLQVSPDGGITVMDLRDRTGPSASAVRPFAGIAAELRFRLSPELALGALPSINMTFAPATSTHLSTGGLEAGGGLRLTYLLRAARPLKPTTPSAPLE